MSSKIAGRKQSSSAELCISDTEAAKLLAKRKAAHKKNYSLQDNLIGVDSAVLGVDELTAIGEFDVLSCSCSEHMGKECLNKAYKMDIEYLYNCLFGYNEFHIAFSQLRKVSSKF